MAHDVAEGRLLAAPSSVREMDDYIERIRLLYGYDNPHEFTEHRVAQNS